MPSKRRKRNPVQILNDGASISDYSKFSDELLARLRPFIFELETLQDLNFEILKHIRPINRTVKNNPKSIQRHIEKVLDHLGLLKIKVEVHKLGAGSNKRVETKHQDKNELFRSLIGGFNKTPKSQLEYLKPKVERHLLEINRLVNYYKNLEEVNENAPRNHRAKTILDFYERTLQERDEILEYYLTGIYERAIQRGKSSGEVFGVSFGVFEGLKDFPYSFGNPILSKTFDYREIDCHSHRLRDIPFSAVPGHGAIYRSNKEKFYRLLFKRRPSTTMFHNIDFHLAYVPTSPGRQTTFAELKRLFKGRRWLAFYALALPQVEGLFAEMVASAKPKSGILSKALPAKVKTVRPDYEFSESYFDYFEYELPNQRNHFSHTGTLTNPKVSAYEILTDLEYVLEVFASLKNPFVSITQILKRKDQQQFFDYFEIAGFFSLINRLEPQRFKELMAEIKDFCQIFLIDDCDLEHSIQNAANDLKTLVDKLGASVAQNFDFQLTDNKVNKNYLKRQLNKEEVFADSIGFFEVFESKIAEVLLMETFFKGVHKFCFGKNIPDHLRQCFSVFDDHKKVVWKLKTWKEQIEMLRNSKE